jgi:ATP-binding cassette subfamily B protein
MTEYSGWRIAGYLNSYFQPKVMAMIYNDTFQNIQKHSSSFFNNNFAGALVKRVNRLVGSFEGIADRITWDLYPMALKYLIILGVLTYLNIVFGVMMIIWTIVFVAFNYGLSKYKLKFDLLRNKADTKVTATLADAITNNINIKLFAALMFEVKRFQKTTTEWFKRTKESWFIGQHIDSGQTLLMIILELVVLYFAVLLWRDGKITVGDFVLIQAYLMELFRQLWDFGRIIRDMYENLAEAEEMTIILHTKPEIEDVKNAKQIKVKSGGVEFENVSFSYDNDQQVIQKLSLKIKPGEKIALIGPSGGGKTTIIKLLLRLNDITQGKILIDNQDISKVTQNSLRSAIALVPQDPILFHRTLEENIRYGRRNATKEEVMAAAKMAKSHDFIMKFKKGYGTQVGERGVKLSGGQRQRIAIARAILSNAQILVLDEATSSLDSESEILIQEALTNLLKNKTTFIIAHRLSTIMKADRILVLDDGKIIEDGSHADLVNKQGSLYKKLWDLQVGGYL